MGCSRNKLEAGPSSLVTELLSLAHLYCAYIPFAVDPSLRLSLCGLSPLCFQTAMQTISLLCLPYLPIQLYVCMKTQLHNMNK